MKLYLAGPISGCSYEGCTSWREHFQNLILNKCAESQQNFDGNLIKCLSPMRGKDYLASEAEISGSYPNHVLSCSRGIMTRDFFDCGRCDIVVANLLGASIVSIGTVMEIAWAYQSRIPVIAVMEEGNIHNHPMIDEAIGFRVPDLEAAVHTTLMILWPE